jgi:hypothetical protein
LALSFSGKIDCVTAKVAIGYVVWVTAKHATTALMHFPNRRKSESIFWLRSLDRETVLCRRES